MDISDMRDRMVDIEQTFKKSSRDKESNEERISTIEKDLSRVMGRDEASDASGTPSLVSKNTDILLLLFLLFQRLFYFCRVN